MALQLIIPTLRSRKKAIEIEAKRRAGQALAKSGLKGLMSKLARFGGWLFGSICRFFNLSFDRLWDIIVDGYFAIKHFDWNATDEALDKMIVANNKRMATAAAQSIGTSLGWGTARLANMFIGRIMGKKSQQAGANAIKVPVLSARVGLALAEEGNEEIAASVKQFLNVTASVAVSNMFISGLLHARRNELFGMKSITQPQSNGSINSKIENQIEKLPEFWRQPAEELLESFEEAIIEAGYVVSYTIDDHVAAMRYANARDVKRTIEVQPHKDSDEKLYFAGTQSQVIQAVQNTMSGTYPLIENRDVGIMAAHNVEEQIKLEPQLRKVTILYCEHESPPFTRKRKQGIRAEISIPDAKPGLTWNELKSLPKFTRGNVYVTCKLDNGRQMSGWFSSFGEGRGTLTAIARFSRHDIIPESFRHSEGSNPNTKKDAKRMHPIRASLLYPKRKDGKQAGIKGDPQTLELWKKTEPKEVKPFK